MLRKDVVSSSKLSPESGARHHGFQITVVSHHAEALVVQIRKEGVDIQTGREEQNHCQILYCLADPKELAKSHIELVSVDNRD